MTLALTIGAIIGMLTVVTVVMIGISYMIWDTFRVGFLGHRNVSLEFRTEARWMFALASGLVLTFACAGGLALMEVTL